MSSSTASAAAGTGDRLRAVPAGAEPDGRFAASVEAPPVASLTDAEVARLRDILDGAGVVALPGQPVDPDGHVAFSRRFGALERTTSPSSRGMGLPPEVAHVGNVDPEGRLLPAGHRKTVYDRGNQQWHSDSSFREVPARYSILSVKVLPPSGGATEFADAAAGYETWPGPPAADGLADLVCEHSIVESRERYTGFVHDKGERAPIPTVRQRLVRRHPATGRRNFYCGSHAMRIVGWPEREGAELLGRILDWCTRPALVHRHDWRADDIVMWDNRRVLHRGIPWPDAEEVRVLHRTTVAGVCSSLEEAA